jgi:HTH-type transcriptional regulator, sugar sensing transcriptional regulator
MNNNELKVLENIGFTHAQAKVYLTLLEVGQSKVGRIIEKSSLQSSVVHNNLNKLVDKGIVNFVLSGKVKLYSVADPKVLSKYVEEQKKEIDFLIPDFERRFKKKTKTEVEVYRGKKGLKSAFTEEYENVPKKGKVKFLALPNEQHYEKEVADFFEKINLNLFDKECFVEGIGNKELKPLWKKIYKNKNYKFRYVKDNFPFDINIFDKSILISLWGEEPIVIRIKDEEFVKQTKRYFEEKWEEGKE